jgi:hypothetical protein
MQDKLKPDELKSRLKAVALLENDFNKKFSEPLVSVKYSSTPASEGAAKSEDPLAQRVTFDLITNTSIRTIEQLKGEWRDLVDTFNADQNKLIDIATETFDLSNRGRKGIRETQQHFLAIELWYRRWWTEQATQINQCRAAMERYASEAGAFIDGVRSLGSASIGAPGSVSSIATSGIFADAAKRFNRSENDARSACSVRSEVYDIPAREDFGGYLGVFGIAARWLLKTESLPLVLITGLLGFGLVGAACSTFIRNVRTRGAGEPFVLNLASVVIRGSSAAVLIFLAVYGGLAVFASGNTNPNPYVVMFACLAAAVFSDDAWTWGEQQFRSRLSGGGDRDPTSTTATTTMTTAEHLPPPTTTTQVDE